MKTYKGLLTELPPEGIFVYGCNTQGRHGAGAAKVAYDKFGAVYGKIGWQGQSYGIVTKNLRKKTHPSISIQEIVDQIDSLYGIATMHPKLDFYVAYSGTGTNLNYYTPNQMARMFACRYIPENMVFEESFAELIKNRNWQEKN
jgi:hypothetical protein